MTKQELHIIKIGGSIVNDPETLNTFIKNFDQVSHPKILVHGGGSAASKLCKKLDIPVRMNEGRRITDARGLDVAVMVYAGLINKKIVAKLQANNCDALGLSGADINIIPAIKRDHPSIDYGFVGDITPENIDTYFLKRLLQEQVIPVFSAITHDGRGQLLNTNADTIAAVLAIAFSKTFTTTLTYCLQKPGVLRNVDDDHSIIPTLAKNEYTALRKQGAIHEGMIPKLDTAFSVLNAGVPTVQISHSDNLNTPTGTTLVA